ncbi:MAG TPA: thioredoxin, partial [Spirochaetia bacterium]|nr:thioredoxin [Spirochaetia bacterium]
NGYEGVHMAEEVTVTRSNFDAEVMKSPVPVVADFWAEWCGPCKMIAPVLKELARDYKDKIKIAKIDVDAEIDLAQQFNIVSIPTILVFNKGQVVKQQIGAVPRPALEKMIKDIV